MLEAIIKKIHAQGWNLEEKDLNLDGKQHELKTDSFKGRYIGSVHIKHRYTTLTMWDWLSGKKRTFWDRPEGLTKKQLQEAHDEASRLEAIIEENRRELQEEVAERAVTMWGKAEGNTIDHPYLNKKKIKPIGVRVRIAKDGAKLLIPMYDKDGRLWNLQQISEDGSKTFLDGGRTKALYHTTGPMKPSSVIYVVEGYATANSLYASTGLPALCCFYADNMPQVGQALRENYPEARIVFSGDNDTKRNPHTSEMYRTGYKASRKAAATVRGTVHIVQTKHGTDWNDLYVEHGPCPLRKQVGSHRALLPWEVLPTEHTGFHEEIILKNGQSKWVPNVAQLAEYYAREFTFRSPHGQRTPYIYEDGMYRKVEPTELHGFTTSHLQRPDKERVETATTKHLAEEFAFLVMSMSQVRVEWFDSTTEGKVNFRNGVLKLHSMSFTGHSPNYGFRTKLPYDYEPGATCPVFDAMLDRVTGGDKDMQKMLMEFAGYAASNDSYWLHRALLLLGEGSNGKSTFLSIIRKMLGQENCASVMLVNLGDDYKRAMIDGKLACISEENAKDENSMYSNESFKMLSSGGVCSARNPYEKPYDFVNRAKFMFAFNRFDRMGDTSKGFTRRLLIANFDQEFSKENGNLDPHIDAKLEAELPGILNRALGEYAVCKQREEITICQSSKDTVEETARNSDSVAPFCEEHLRRGEDKDFINVGEVYSVYRGECEDAGQRPVGRTAFTQRISRLIWGVKLGTSVRWIEGKTTRVMGKIRLARGGDF